MTRLTFGVSVSPFAANMCIRQNAMQHQNAFPLAAPVILKSFYVDDGLTDANIISEAIKLWRELQELFAPRGFLLRKWKYSKPMVLKHLSHDLIDQQPSRELPAVDNFTKVLGLEWTAELDAFRLTSKSIPHDPTPIQVVTCF